MGKYVIDNIKEGEVASQIVIVYQNDDGTKELPREDCKEFWSIGELCLKLEELNKDLN